MNVVLANYFNQKGNIIYQARVEVDRAANDGTGTTTKAQGALAVQALLAVATRKEVGLLPLARKVRSVSVDGMKPILVGEVMWELEANYGATSVQWARAIFTHLKLKPPSIQ